MIILARIIPIITERIISGMPMKIAAIVTYPVISKDVL